MLHSSALGGAVASTAGICRLCSTRGPGQGRLALVRESETKDLRDADRVHVSVTLDAQNGRHRGELTIYGAGRSLLFGPVGPAVWDHVFGDPNVWHERDELMRLITDFELGVLGLTLTGDRDAERFLPADSGGGPLLFSGPVERLW